jgi:glyoxylase-like metal-dependent hydrolase (beta-lactamase superfamily II)
VASALLGTDHEALVIVQHFYDEATATLTYVVHDEAARVGVVIDPVTDFDPKSGWTGTASCDRVAAYVDAQRLAIPFVLDTHAHADHLSGIPFFVDRYGARSVIGWRITAVQAMFRDIFNLGADFPVDGRQFDVLLHDGEILEAGRLRIRAHYTPGHTPACLTYEIGDALFVGDVLFMPDYGTARCDFPGGSADALYDSVKRLYALPPERRVFTCHDYRPGGRPLRFASTIGDEGAANVQLNATTSRADFLRFRRTRDAQLTMPALILPSVQVNVRAGRFPAPEPNGVAYLKLPLNAFGRSDGAL